MGAIPAVIGFIGVLSWALAPRSTFLIVRIVTLMYCLGVTP
jgi:hypothetical protein